MNLSKYKYLLTQGGISFLFRIIGLVFTFVIIKLISKFYTVETYGGFSIMQTFTLIFLIIFTLGVQNTIVIEQNKHNYNEDSLLSFIIKIYKLIGLVSIIPFLVFTFGATYLAELYNNPELKQSFIILGFAFPLLLFHDIFVYYFIAVKNFLKFGLFMFFLPNFIFLIFIVFTYQTYNTLYFLTLFFCLSFVITFLIEFLWSYAHSKPVSIKSIAYKPILKLSIPMMLSGLMQLLLNWTDIFMLGIMRSNEEVGLYNVAFKVGSIMLIFLATLSTIILPKISEFYESGNMPELKKIVNQSTKLGALISTPCFIILIIAGRWILSFFGEEYNESYTVLVLIASTGYFGVLCGNIDQILNMSNNQKVLLYINGIALILNIVLNLIFIPKYGIEGAAMATLITTVLMKSVCVYVIRIKLGFYPINI